MYLPENEACMVLNLLWHSAHVKLSIRPAPMYDVCTLLCFYPSVMFLMLWPSIAYNALLRKAYIRLEPTLEWLNEHFKSKAQSVISKCISNCMYMCILCNSVSWDKHFHYFCCCHCLMFL